MYVINDCFDYSIYMVKNAIMLLTLVYQRKNNELSLCTPYE